MRARVLAFTACLTLAGSQAFGQGFVMPAVGPVNKSMGGAGTAAPLDATGALHWNPASISGLSSSRFDVGVELLMNRNHVNSTLTLLPPPFDQGSTDSDVGVVALPAIGLVRRDPGSPWTAGLGLNTIGGFSVNFPASTTNPIFTPQFDGAASPAPPPFSVGLGGAYSRLAIVQLAPTLAYEFAGGFSVGVAPTIDMADAQASPFPFAPPDDANGSGVPTYPDAMGNRPRWGAGVQAGVYYESPAGVNLGVSIKSPQWFESFEFNSTDETGFPRKVSAQLEYPMILSFGAAYTPVEDILLAVDVRWVDYESTQTFGEPAVINPATGALRGLGWDSVWLIAFGAQFELTERLTLRTGYSYNENPIAPSTTMFNILAPGIFQHVYSAGASWKFTESLIGTLTWVHGFDNTITGPYLTPGGPAPPPSRVSLSQEIDSVLLGLSVVY